MTNKSKGSKAERELFSMFVENGYRSVRVAGSGTMENADCDLLAGKKGRKYAIEVKSSKKPVKYITKEQIENFLVFSSIFTLKPVIAVRFNRIGWFFLDPKHMKLVGKNFMVNLEIAQKKGKRFAQFFMNNKSSKKNKDNKKDNYMDEVLDCEEFYDEIEE